MMDFLREVWRWLTSHGYVATLIFAAVLVGVYSAAQAFAGTMAKHFFP